MTRGLDKMIAEDTNIARATPATL
eukprot:gene26892-biopygen17475